MGERKRDGGGAVRRLLGRPFPPGYREQWTELLARPPEPERGESLAVVVFRLGDRRLALPAAALREVAAPHPIQRIPHRDDPVVLGIVALRGELRVAVSLEALLEIDAASESVRSVPRFVVAEQAGDIFVLPVAEVVGLHGVPLDALEQPPADVRTTVERHTRGRFTLGEKTVILLDDELVFHSLRRRLE